MYREEEREMIPLCVDQRIGLIPWSPLARGRLARPWAEKDATARSGSDEPMARMYRRTEASDRATVERLTEVAGARGLPQAQVALAWVLSKPAMTSPIIGATKPGHLEDALAALDVKLAADEIARLEEPYVPHPTLGFE
jgi:1-deoxyxylulose-5-phosphate synthase